ncbi:cation-translocating P-type ATPase [Halobacteriovorax sp. RT-1-4]|uniref:cation-translocating P-type ATPase n=1 Tax=unclassified Halobacteriovorax TaxID=2639665 RepID=UPI003999C65C
MQKKVSFSSLVGLTGTPNGLDEKEVSKQRLKFGPNEIVERIGNPWIDIIIDTLKDPMVWFLVGISAVFYLVGDYTESLILMLATLPLIFMDAFLHLRTQVSTAALRSQLSSKVILIRNGKKVEVDSYEIVPGDLVVLSSEGAYLPADGFWEEADSLQVDESVLTGEAFPIKKNSIHFDPFKNTADTLVETNILGFAGTRVLAGKGNLRILSTGRNTSYGEIVQSVAQIAHERTPLQSAILELTRFLIYAAVMLCFIIAAVRLYQGHGWLDALLSAAVLAVAAIPEEFPVVFSFFLGVGVYRLAKHNALVRRAVSVENIGRVTQICTDKTGTITVGNLELTHFVNASDTSESHLLTMALAASNRQGADPVDIAIINEAKNRNTTILNRLSVIPFTEDRKRETAFIEYENTLRCVIKGAPEIVLSKSSLNDEEKKMWGKEIETLAKGGHKVLAVAALVVNDELVESCLEPEEGFHFYGLLAFEDPARPEVKEALKYCMKNEIKVLMITGDHPDTARAIAKDIGLIQESAVIISAESEPHKLEEEWLQDNPGFFKGVDVVARCNPVQKFKIVESLKKAGELVVVTGDGVNDVPALKAADIGVAMGLRGTRSAREVSSIILSDDNFSTIVNAIREGKQLFENLRMSFKYLLLIHIPFVLSAALIPLLGYKLLYLPIHVVWLELVIHPTALFAFQQNINLDTQKDLSHRRSFFNKKELMTILTLGLSLTAILIISYISAVSESQDVAHGRAKAMALLSLWSAGIVIALTKCRTTAANLIILCTILLSLVLTQYNLMANALHLSPLHLMDWIRVIFIAFVFVLILFLLDSPLKKNFSLIK